MRDVISLGMEMLAAHLGDLGATLRMNNRGLRDVRALCQSTPSGAKASPGVIYLVRASELSHDTAVLHQAANFLVICDEPLDFDKHLGGSANAILVPGTVNQQALVASTEACIRGMARAAEVAPRLLEVVLAKGRPHDAMLVVSEALGCAVALYDSHLKGVDFSDKDYWEQAMRRIARPNDSQTPPPNDIFTETFSDLSSGCHYPMLVEMDNDKGHFKWASFFVKVDGAPRYLFGALERDRPLSEEDLPLIAYACEVLGVLQSRLQPRDDREISFSLINRLLDSEEDDPSLLFDLDRAIGSRIGENSHVLVISNPTLEHPYLYLTKIQMVIRLALPGSFNFLRGTRVIVVLKREVSLADAEQLVRTSVESTGKSGWNAAISLSFDSVEGLRLAYQQAEHAMDYGVRLRPNDTFYDYRDYLIYDFLDDASRSVRLRNYVDPTWTRIEDYDQRHGTEYGVTLATYLRYSKDINQTASILFVHRNTVRYRLERVAELFGIDLDDDTTSANLILAGEIAYFCDKQRQQEPTSE